MAKKQPQQKTPGRPAGSPNEQAVQTTVPTSRCPKCGSTEREPYYNRRELAIAGVTADGQPYTHVVWRRTRCKSCNQVRDDRTYEQRP